MTRYSGKWMRRLAEERGATMVTALFFFFCLGGLLSILLLQEQADLWEMHMQQTADTVSKGARAAGKWEYVNSRGKEQKRLLATSAEARRYDADIIRGAREEAQILWSLNIPDWVNEKDTVTIVHQRGEMDHLYRQGIYHVSVELKKEIPLFWDMFDLRLERVSQSEI
jgi:hypothetical protein